MNSELFWNKVEIQGLDQCWAWKAGVGTNGYGKFRSKNQLYSSHRAAFLLTRGAITPGLSVLHSCDNPLCCNPTHLWEGTHGQNMRDMVNKGRHVPGVLLGEDAPSSKLTVDGVKLIREDPRTLKEISKELNISVSQISKIKRRKSWSHI